MMKGKIGVWSLVEEQETLWDQELQPNVEEDANKWKKRIAVT
jgi:hypothetical protein